MGIYCIESEDAPCLSGVCKAITMLRWEDLEKLSRHIEYQRSQWKKGSRAKVSANTVFAVACQLTKHEESEIV